VLLTTVSLLAGGGYAGWHEMQTSELQARWLSRYAASLDYRIEPGASEQVLFPDDGPFDRRLGYVDIPRFAERLLRQGFRIEAQARFSPALLEYSSRGFFVPYPEKPHKFSRPLFLRPPRGAPPCRPDPRGLHRRGAVRQSLS